MSEQDERALFAVWAKTRYENLGGEFAGPGESGWYYWDDETSNAWEGWQARAALAQGAQAAQGGGVQLRPLPKPLFVGRGYYYDEHLMHAYAELCVRDAIAAPPAPSAAAAIVSGDRKDA